MLDTEMKCWSPPLQHTRHNTPIHVVGVKQLFWGQAVTHDAVNNTLQPAGLILIGKFVFSASFFGLELWCLGAQSSSLLHYGHSQAQHHTFGRERPCSRWARTTCQALLFCCCSFNLALGLLRAFSGSPPIAGGRCFRRRQKRSTLFPESPQWSSWRHFVNWWARSPQTQRLPAARSPLPVW